MERQAPLTDSSSTPSSWRHESTAFGSYCEASEGRAGFRTSAGCRRLPPRRFPRGTPRRSPPRRRRHRGPARGIRTSARRESPGWGQHRAHNRDSRRGQHRGCPEGDPSPAYGENQRRHSVPILESPAVLPSKNYGKSALRRFGGTATTLRAETVDVRPATAKRGAAPEKRVHGLADEG